MEYSKQGEELTESFEGVRLTAYQDSVGVWTIGYGHTEGVHEGMTCTQAQAEEWLVGDVAFTVSYINKRLTSAVTQGEFDALVDFTYNLGVGTLERSGILTSINEGKHDEVAALIPQYDHAGDKVLPGLLRRRDEEVAEFEEVPIPILEFTCPAGHVSERLIISQSVAEHTVSTKCSTCGATAERSISKPAPPILVAGSGGFYKASQA